MSGINMTEYCMDAANVATNDCALLETMTAEINAVTKSVTEAIEDVAYGVDVFFLLFSGALVFLMQAGFAMLCAGCIRQKNVKNIMLQSLLDACGGAIGFWSIGYALAYGDKDGDGSNIRFVGNHEFFIKDSEEGKEYIGWFFQWAFAATGATIVAGTVAERCKMSAYLCYSIFLTGFVYPVVVHSIWAPDGFLSAFHSTPFRGIGAIDFAGSGVVHLTGGCTSLVAAIILGPRKGRFHDEDGNVLDTPVTFQPHSVALQILGTFLLWFGWYGFNPGSALAIANSNSAAVAGLCAVTSTIGAAAGGVTAMFLDTFVEHMNSGEASYDITMATNGLLAGLVAITAGCSVITPWAALLIGAVGGVVYYAASKALIALKIDDAVDAIPVHFANGIWGMIAVGLFAEPSRQAMAYSGNITHVGWFYNTSDANLLLVQIVAVCWVLGWVTVVMTPFFLMLNYAGMFRVDSLEEEVGLDISSHRGSAYEMTGPSAENVEKLMEVRASKHGRVDIPKETASAPVAAEEVDNEETA